MVLKKNRHLGYMIALLIPIVSTSFAYVTFELKQSVAGFFYMTSVIASPLSSIYFLIGGYRAITFTEYLAVTVVNILILFSEINYFFKIKCSLKAFGIRFIILNIGIAIMVLVGAWYIPIWLN